MLRNKYVLIFWLVVFLAGFCFAGSQGDLNKPDTVKVESIAEVGPNQSFVVAVTAFSDELVAGINLPLTFHSKNNTDITCDSVKWSDWVMKAKPYLEVASVDTTNSKVRIGAVWFKKGLPPGNGTLAEMYFHTGPKWNKKKGLVIDTTVCYPPPSGAYFEFVEATKAKTFKPVFVKGRIGKK